MDKSRRKILDQDQLPEGPMRRYVRDIYAMSNANSPFEEFEEKWHVEYNAEVMRLNQTNPVEYDQILNYHALKDVDSQEELTNVNLFTELFPPSRRFV